MSKKNYTDITVVLDRSGSMASVATDTIGGFNTFLADQKKAPGTATITLNQFDHEFQTVLAAVDLQKAAALTSETFVPRGNTALLDALGRSINETGKRLEALPEGERPEKVVFVTITDGHENASHKFNRSEVFDMVKHQREKYGWEFVFLGANQDAIDVGVSLGTAAANSMTYASTSAGVTAAYCSVSDNIRAFRGGSKADTSFEKKDLDEQAKAGVQNP